MSTTTIKTETLGDVPTSELDALAKEFRAAGATVTLTLQPDGKWTLTATYKPVVTPTPT